MYVCALHVNTKLYFWIYATLGQFHKLQICFVFLSRNCSSAICRRWGGSDLSHPRWYPWLLCLQWPIPTAGGGTVCVSDWSTCHATILVAGFSLVQIWLRQCQKHVESYPEEQSGQDTLCEFGWLGHLWVDLCMFCLLTLSLPAILFCVPYHYITCIGCPKMHFFHEIVICWSAKKRHKDTFFHPPSPPEEKGMDLCGNKWQCQKLATDTLLFDNKRSYSAGMLSTVLRIPSHEIVFKHWAAGPVH